MPVCIHKLSTNQKIIHKSFIIKKPYTTEGGRPPDPKVSIFDPKSDRQPPGILISYPILGFVFISPFFGCLVLEMAVSLPGRQNPSAASGGKVSTTDLYDFILSIIRHDEVNPLFIRQVKQFLTKIQISDNELKIINSNLNGFLSNYHREEKISHPMYDKLVAKLIATNSAFALPFYLPVQNAIINAVKIKRTDTIRHTVSMRQDVRPPELSEGFLSKKRFPDSGSSEQSGSEPKPDRTTDTDSQEETNIRSIVLSVLQSLENDNEIVPGGKDDATLAPLDEYPHKDKDTAPLHKQTSVRHANNTASKGPGLPGHGLHKNRKDQYSEAMILTPNQHELCVKLQDRVASLNGIITGVKGSGKSEMLIMKLSSVLNRINENKLLTAMIVVGYIWPDIEMHLNNLNSPLIFHKFHKLYQNVNSKNITFHAVIANNESQLFHKIRYLSSVTITEVHVFVENVVSVEALIGWGGLFLIFNPRCQKIDMGKTFCIFSHFY